ncbi:MAG TPA: DUF1326 domain-containing protein [Bacillus sp. (in: firmicutes)]|nr:DUF1326 domain-containing protein [Bacillus sp. (in: firmicutes)]
MNNRDRLLVIFYQAKRRETVLLYCLLGTFKYFLEPQFVDINVNIDGKKSSFSVPGIIDVQIESFLNPVTGKEQETKVQLPNGFIWKLAEAAKSKLCASQLHV